jgi:SpoVK/Ycf46/Vps4 family AAA+-type ATPase
MKTPLTFSTLLQTFFTERLMKEFNASPHTIANYRDTFRLLIACAQRRLNKHLPNQAEREAIWGIQIGKHGRAPADFDVVQLGRATEGLTGSEIENVFIEALYMAFDSGADGEKEPTDLDIARVLTEFVPLSKLMAEQIGMLRNWSKGRSRLATSPGIERGLRKLVV